MAHGAWGVVLEGAGWEGGEEGWEDDGGGVCKESAEDVDEVEEAEEEEEQEEESGLGEKGK